MDFNKVILTGNLVRDPETKFAASGTQITEFTLAVNGSNDVVSYIDCVAFDKTASLAAEYLTKGSPILLEGYLKQERWEHEGQKRSRIRVTVYSMKFLGKASGSDNGSFATHNEPEKVEFFGSDDTENSDSDEIPF